eukprot:86159-Pelagomonas_calceolata.AAC.6
MFERHIELCAAIDAAPLTFSPSWKEWRAPQALDQQQAAWLCPRMSVLHCTEHPAASEEADMQRRFPCGCEAQEVKSRNGIAHKMGCMLTVNRLTGGLVPLKHTLCVCSSRGNEDNLLGTMHTTQHDMCPNPVNGARRDITRKHKTKKRAALANMCLLPGHDVPKPCFVAAHHQRLVVEVVCASCSDV